MSEAATQALVRVCQDTERAAQGALAWFRDFPDRVAAQRPVLEKEFRLAAVEARKLKTAAERPVAVGVYGLSQAGKSYLISTLARPSGKELTADLDKPRGFLADINPESDKEATGLVTRFTMRKEKGPEGFPVRLRLLSEIDLVKILANSWFCDALDSEKASAGLPEAIAEVLGAAERDAAGQAENNEVRQEDIWDLSKYCDNEFRGFASAQTIRSGPFWDRMAAVLPRLPLDRRVDVYAILWNRYAPFTDVLARLTSRLRALRFDREAWAPIVSLVPKTESVLKVDTLDHLADTGQTQIEIAAQNGARCTLTRPELTALIAELQITMVELPWPIFQATDLLDFPGARERTGKDHALEVQTRANALGEFFLRGKVAYLFERYAAERELNALLLCIKESNNAFDATIRQSIRNWINRTHGATPEGRSRVETALFVMLTRMDMHFNRTPGRDDSMASDDLWEARVKASLLQPLQEANGWLDAWHPGQPFSNTLLARNPGKSQSLSRLTDDGVEGEFLPGVPEKIERWGREFSANTGIRRYVRNPEKAWAEVFRLNDAGMSYLVESLAPVCRPELKLNQLNNQIAILRGDMKRRLSEWHVGDDLDAEYQKRLEGLRPALDLLEANGNAGRFGLLLSQFHLTPAEAREVLLRALPTTEATRAAPPAATGAVSSMRDRLRARAQPAAAAPVEHSAGSDPTHDRASALLSAWIAKLRRFSTESSLHSYFGFDGPAADALVAEMTATASRCRLQHRLVDGLNRIKGGLRFDQAADRRAVLVSQLVNEHVNFLGMSLDGVLAADRPQVEGGPPAFDPTPPPEPGFEIGEEAEPFGPLFVLSWVDVLADAVKRNVFDQGGAGMVDQKQNEALGTVLALL
ncbi:MAG: virulence factor SrfC family protein [Alphaproteobacteria bacterium]|nr:virulence factor SrfC family protein [Alphaproteobacteria bacterium]